MPVKIDPSGRRSIQVEVEVPGTVEQVWQAIATGPGVSAWFVPCEIDQRVGGQIVCRFGPGMDSAATVKEWEAPHRFVAESGDLGPQAPGLASEWTVEARTGGTCVVRVVNSLFADSDDWDNQLTSVESGWPGFFRLLRLYLEHFPGQPCSSFRVMGVSRESEVEAWATLTTALGLTEAAVGERRGAPEGQPALAGTVESAGGHPRVIILRSDRPAPGLVSAGAHAMGGKIFLMMSFYLYGDPAAAAVAREEPAWQAWMAERFPMS